MNRRITSWVVVLALAGLLTGCGGRGCSGNKAPASSGASGTQAAASDDEAKAPSPAPGSTVAAVESVAAMLPVQLSSVGVFPASRLHEAIERLPAVVPRLAYTLRAEDFLTRLRNLFGVELSGIQGVCAFADVQEAGPVILCPGGQLVPVKDAYRWTSGAVSGHDVTRNGVVVSLAVVDPYLVVGTPEAVRRVVQVSQRAWPRFLDARSRWFPAFTEAAGEDEFGHSALFFMDPATAPWCGTDCEMAAVFASADGVRAISRAGEDRIGALESRVTEWWGGIREAFAQIHAAPDMERPFRMTDAWLKPGDLLTRTGTLRTRGQHVFFKGSGDPLVVLLTLNPELPRRWLTEIPVAPAAVESVQ